jgi:hypothetical protein
MIGTGDVPAIQRMMNSLGAEIRSLVRQAFELSYFSRGAWSYTTVLQMTAAEREIAADFLNERLKLAFKMQHPVF